MSKYLQEVTKSLTDVFDRAVRINDHLIFGFGANVEFWADEVDHRLRILRGFASRQELFDKALKTKIRKMREAGVRQSPSDHFYGEVSDPVAQGEMCAKVAELETAIIDSAKPFFRRLWKRKAITFEEWSSLQQRFDFLQ